MKQVFSAFCLIVIVGCGGTRDQTEAIAAEPAKPVSQAKPPFEFKEISRDDKRHDWGPQLFITLETTNAVAKKATKKDLQALWEYFEPEFGDRRAFIHVKTDVPGAMPWAIIRRTADLDGKTNFEIELIDYGIDAKPYFFPDKIDRSIENQQAMMLTLPVVNRLVDLVKQSNWTVSQRTENFVHLKVDAFPQSATMSLTPEHLSFDGHRLDDAVFVSTIAAILDELGIGEQVKAKLQSVIGSPKYLRAKAGNQAEWTWPIRDLEVEYTHYDVIDTVYVTYRQPQE